MAPTHRNKNSQMAPKNGLVSLGEGKCLCHQGKESVMLCSFQKRGHTFSYWFYFLFGSKIMWEEAVNIPGDKPRCWKICVRTFLNPIFFPEISWQVSLGALHHQGHDHMGTLEEGAFWQPMAHKHTSWVPICAWNPLVVLSHSWVAPAGASWESASKAQAGHVWKPCFLFALVCTRR